MQISHSNLPYQIKVIEGNFSKKAYRRKEKLDKMALLASEGCSEEVALTALNIARATYYRWKKNYKIFGIEGLENESQRPHKLRKPVWSPNVEMKIYHLRKKFPVFGKQKIAVMYKRIHKETVSVSTVGRILTKLIKASQVMPVPFIMGRKDKKRRVFNGHAQRWKKSMKSSSPGQLIQIDHMSIGVSGSKNLKHFTAICPTSRWTAYHVYTSATSTTAADFLERIKEEFPFKISSIQVDGGSEFMADFEKACFKNKIPLYVLPPRSPEDNGAVERSNGTAKYEFYAQYNSNPSLFMVRKRLKEFTHFYNYERPHQGIHHFTPSQYYEKIRIGP